MKKNSCFLEQPNRREFENDDFWPQTPPSKYDNYSNLQEPIEIEPAEQPAKSEFADNEMPSNSQAEQEINDECCDIYIRESKSAPLDTPKSASNETSKQRPDSQKAFDVFRPPGHQRAVGSGSSDSSRQYLLKGVNEGVRIDSQRPILEDSEHDLTAQMWEDAAKQLSQDNKKRKYKTLHGADGGQEGNKFDMSDVFCLCPCCCCCFCLCRRPKETKS